MHGVPGLVDQRGCLQKQILTGGSTVAFKSGSRCTVVTDVLKRSGAKAGNATSTAGPENGSVVWKGWIILQDRQILRRAPSEQAATTTEDARA